MRRLTFSIPQFHAMKPLMEEAGMQPTMFPSSEKAPELYRLAARGLPCRTMREYVTREAILNKLTYAMAGAAGAIRA